MIQNLHAGIAAQARTPWQHPRSGSAVVAEDRLGQGARIVL